MLPGVQQQTSRAHKTTLNLIHLCFKNVVCAVSMNKKQMHMCFHFALPPTEHCRCCGVTLPQRAANADRFHLVWLSMHSLVTSLGFHGFFCVPWWSKCVSKGFSTLTRTQFVGGIQWILGKNFYGIIMI